MLMLLLPMMMIAGRKDQAGQRAADHGGYPRQRQRQRP